jgi:hypothetical protein
MAVKYPTDDEVKHAYADANPAGEPFDGLPWYRRRIARSAWGRRFFFR